MEYYHSLITQKSQQELSHLKKLAEFVLIGGWAVYFYSKTLKSKDIDILISFDQLPILEKQYLLQKNERLQKYQATKGEIEIDIYLPHFSEIGITVEELMKHTTLVDGFNVVDINYLFVLKVFTLSQRGRSSKGRKDFLDILSLALTKRCNWQEIKKVIKQYKMEQALVTFEQFLKESNEAKELSLNAYGFAQLKKEIKLWN